MKKKLWVLLLAAALLLSGCGREEVPEPTAPPLIEVEVPYEETTVELKYADTELTFRSLWTREDPCARVLTEAASIFEYQTGAAVTILWPENNTAVQEELPQADMFQLSWADFGAMPAEELLDLTELAENAGYADQSHETLREQITQQCGYLGAVAQMPYLGGIYYSTDVFTSCGIQTIPATWEEFLAVCEVLRAAGWQPLTMDREDTLVAMELHLRRSLGNEEMERLMGKKGHWNTDLPAIAALEQVRLFVQEGNMSTGSPADYPAGQNKIATSNSAMMIGTNADCADVEEAALTDLNWGIFPYPGSTGSGLYMTADVIAISPDCENPQAAFDFLMLLVTGEFDQLRADLSEGIPADPRNASPVAGAMEAISQNQPETLRYFGRKQQDVAWKLWSGWYRKAAQYASLLELSK
jgi:raffinose/stachyose/melibiose transport system substrate-binding protein